MAVCPIHMLYFIHMSISTDFQLSIYLSICRTEALVFKKTRPITLTIKLVFVQAFASSAQAPLFCLERLLDFS